VRRERPGAGTSAVNDVTGLLRGSFSPRQLRRALTDR
jgi:hypothetical protein